METLVVLLVVGAILKPDTFPTADNLRAVLTQASVVGVLAIAMTNVIPMARTPTTLAWVRTARRLSAVGNVSGSRMAPTTSRTTMTAPSVYS